MKAFYCVGTHWDREWYEPFQEYRMWLVELIDELMDLMDPVGGELFPAKTKPTGGESFPAYQSFHLDGQAVVLQDYLEIRPERRERLVKMLKAGRLIAGPWYDLPDEWLISGESYVRNLMMGMRVCREMGVEPMQFAYTPDQFGHIAALPMIMTGFDLKAGICWRGTQDEHYPAQFIWVGPDGSRMITHKLRDVGSYGPFDFAVRGQLKREGYPPDKIAEYFDPYFKAESDRADVPLVLMLDAIDHQQPDHKMPWLLEELRKRYPDVEFLWTSLAQYGAEMLKHADKLPERTGELRQPCLDSTRGGQYLIVHTISSRYPIKKRNDQCQALMEKWAEPYALFQTLAGDKGLQPLVNYLNKAWEYLLRNSPHDSICGCSVDQVHRDMHYRFDQCEMIADGVIRRAMAATAHASNEEDALTNVVVHNPLPYAGTRVVEVPLVFRSDWPTRFVDGLATGELVNKFILTTKDGKRLPFQLSKIERGAERKILRDNGRNGIIWGDMYHVAVELSLPACGFTGFKIEPTQEGTRNFGSLMTGPLAAANDTCALTLKPDGTAVLRLVAQVSCLQNEPEARSRQDACATKETVSGKSFDNLFLYEDCGDSGDGWTRGQLINDIVFRSPGTRVTTAIDENGPLRTVFRIEREFDLPRMMDRKTYWRSADRLPMRVTDLLYVEKGSPFVRVRTRIENSCMDHRFRVLFPTMINAATSFAETPFAVVERDIDIPSDTAVWQEKVNPEKAFTTFFGVQDAEGGLAVLAPFGLHEYEVLRTPDRSLALTLFRSFFKTVNNPGEPDGELLGTMDFEYLLYPFKGKFDATTALRLIAETQAGIWTHTAKELPDDCSFLRLKNKTAVTAIKPAAEGEGAIIRLWNPKDEAVNETITLAHKIVSAKLCDLNEQSRQDLQPNPDGSVMVTVPPRGLTTVRLNWK